MNGYSGMLWRQCTVCLQLQLLSEYKISPAVCRALGCFPVADLTLSLVRSTAGMRLTCPVAVSLDRYTPRTTASTNTPRRQNSSTRARGIRTRSQPGREPPPPACWSGLYLRLDLDMTEHTESPGRSLQLRVKTGFVEKRRREIHTGSEGWREAEPRGTSDTALLCHNDPSLAATRWCPPARRNAWHVQTSLIQHEL